jgi:hypothetical protein
VVSSARLTLGAGYGWGSSSVPELLDVLDDESEDVEPRYVYRRLRTLFGFELGVN